MHGAKGIMVSYRIKRKEVAWKDVVGAMDKIGIERCMKIYKKKNS